MNRIRVVILVIIIIWSAVSLSMILQNIYSGPERSIISPPLSQAMNTTYPGFPISTGIDIIEIMEYTVFAWIILFIVSLVIYFKSTLKILYKAIMSFLGLFIILGIVYIVSALISHINTSTSSSVQGIKFSSQEIIGTLPIILGIGVLSFLFIYIISKNFYLPSQEKNVKISKTISEMISELKFGNDVRGSIMKAYYDLSNLLKKYGIIEREYLTPREFENLSIEKVHLDSKPFETIVKLFEEARYSSHEMDENQREEAILALEKIKKLLGEIE
ncbi:MAG: DUF4129 domain-containing protein [Thermoplasmata archaeon]